jgi:glutamate-1-semialdehyde 2,1-aminomutase
VDKLGNLKGAYGNSQELFDRSLKIAPGGVHSPVRAFKSVGGTPLFFSRSDGAYIESVEGYRYIDFCQSFGPMILGHRDPDVKAAVSEMLDTAWSLGACEPYSLELAEWITSRLPFMESVRFVSSGTEAVMSALRVARGFTGRTKILKFDGCYHGHVDSMLVKAGSGLAGEAATDSAGVPDAHETLVAPLNDLPALEKIYAERGKEIAAVIIEPLPANFGLLIQSPEYIRALVDGARKQGILVIFDEVISGFRVHPKGMAGVLGIEPDLATYGKVVGGGFPLGAFGGRKKYMDLVAPSGPVYQAGTLSANPISTRAGLTTLEKVEKHGIIEALTKRTEKFRDDLIDRFKKVGAEWTVTSMGSLFWIHPKAVGPIRSTRDFPPGLRENFPKFFHAALKEGVYLAPSAVEVGFLSWAHTDEVLAKALDSLERAAAVLRS